MQDIKFKDIRKYCSQIDCVSICSYETMEYENFDRISMVPNLYDDKYVYGFGIIESGYGNGYRNYIEFCLSDLQKEECTNYQNRKRGKD